MDPHLRHSAHQTAVPTLQSMQQLAYMRCAVGKLLLHKSLATPLTSATSATTELTVTNDLLLGIWFALHVSM